jgi:hypothetical protein
MVPSCFTDLPVDDNRGGDRQRGEAGRSGSPPDDPSGIFAAATDGPAPRSLKVMHHDGHRDSGIDNLAPIAGLPSNSPTVCCR